MEFDTYLHYLYAYNLQSTYYLNLNYLNLKHIILHCVSHWWAHSKSVLYVVERVFAGAVL